MRILLAVHQFFPEKTAGTEVLTLEMARGLSARGHAVEVLAGVAETNMPESCTPWMTRDIYAGLEVNRLHYGTKRRANPVSTHWIEANRVGAVCRLVSKFSPDVVHFIHVIGISGATIPAIRRMKIPVFFSATDYWVACPKIILYRIHSQSVCDGPGDGTQCLRCFRPMPEWMANLAMKAARFPLTHCLSMFRNIAALHQRPHAMSAAINAATRVFASTHFLAEVLVRNGVQKDKISVVPYGVDIGLLPEMLPVPKQFSSSSPLHLGFIGTITAIKGPHLLLEALGLLGKQKEDVTLDIYGKMDPNDAYCRQLYLSAQQGGLPVQFQGTFSHNAIGKVLRSLHALVIPSVWYESAPLVLCSSLAAGVPVLVSQLGGLTENIREGENGTTFSPGNAGSLSQKIFGLLGDPASIKRMQESYHSPIPSVADYVCRMEAEYQEELERRA